MKHFLGILLAFITFSTLNAQDIKVKWTTEVEQITDTEYNLIYKAEIKDKWHLYSQFIPEEATIPTSFSYNEDQLGETFELIGKTEEGNPIVAFDKVFQMDLPYFEKEATFVQKIKLLKGDVSSIEGEVSYQACDDESCIFESEILNFNLTANSSAKAKNNSQIYEPVQWSSKAKKLSDDEYELEYTATLDNKWHIYSQKELELGPIPTTFDFKFPNVNYKLEGKTEESQTTEIFEDAFGMTVWYFENKAVFKQKIKLLNKDAKYIEAEVEFQACDDEKCLPPNTHLFKTSLDGKTETKTVATMDERSIALSNKLDLGVTGWDKYEQEDVKEKSNFTIFLLGFLGGLIALLTPCVFPMIPLTVSFFTKSAGNAQKGIGNSIMYGFFILLIYFLLSLPFHVLDSLDPEILNNVSTNVTLNIIFFVIFILFAFSFFGYFELTLPSSWSNKLDSKANSIGGLIGVFLMALTLAIVSFSCTGPILGTLLGSSLTSDGGAMQLTLGMTGFGLALALPFSLFAMFPKWLNSLPKSGGWLNTVKVVLGFIEIALALKFLSNADLVKHWGILKREVFIGLWIIIGIGLVLYLLGKIKFPHDGPFKKISFSKWAFIILVASFVIYLIPGLTNTKYANLKLLSGFPPPLPYSIYQKDSDCPLGLNCYKDIDEGIAAAKEQNKPIMLDFTGWACVNCRKMEEQVWSKDEIYNMLNDEFIIISLYVDDKRALPKEEQFKYLKPSGNLKNIKTIGDKLATLQTINFQNNSQPYYVLLNHDMELLNHTIAYTPNAEVYFKWLELGLNNFKGEAQEQN
ncbi:cytochrome c biogenesis protein CcdA [Lacinutrix salivirga]